MDIDVVINFWLGHVIKISFGCYSLQSVGLQDLSLSPYVAADLASLTNHLISHEVAVTSSQCNLIQENSVYQVVIVESNVCLISL